MNVPTRETQEEPESGDAGDLGAVYLFVRSVLGEPTERSKPLPPEFGGRFKEVERIKEGGMGDFYRAYDETLHRYVGLKTVKSTSPEERDNLLTEARIAGRLPNEAVAAIHDIVWYDKQPIIKMELVDGHPLSEEPWTRPRNRREVKQAVELLLTAARALASAHDRGIFHGDFKPANVMLTKDGKPKLIDFGLGRRADLPAFDDPRARGTLPYMAPEQTLGKVTAKSDMYSFGVVLHQRLTGELPIEAETRDWLDAIRNQPPKPAGAVNRKIDAGLSAIVARCLAKDPDRRYEQMADVVADLENWLAGRALIASPDPALLKPVRGIYRFGRRHPVWTAVLLLVPSFLVAIYWKDARRTDEERRRLVGEMATHVGIGADDYMHTLEATAQALRQAPAPTVAGLIASWNAAVKSHPVSSLADLIGRPERRRVQEALEALVDQPLSAAVDHWLAFDATGTMVARTPERSDKVVVGLDFHDRDYFMGAWNHVGLQGRAAIHVSNAYESVGDGKFKYTFSMPLMGADGRSVVGVLAASSTARLRLGFNLMLIAPRDPNQLSPELAVRRQLVVLEHPTGASGVTFFSARLADLAVRAECGHEFDRRTFSDEQRYVPRFRDPLSDLTSEDDWMATVAPVASTGFIVVTERTPP